MKIESIAITNVGHIRENNEDNYFLCGQYREDVSVNTISCTCEKADGEGLFGVCDGMGGAQFGELASLIAVKSMAEYSENFDAVFQDCIGDANAKICDEIADRGGRRIGTTFAALCIKDGAARAYNIGDSRIYMLRGGKLTQLSVDHTQAQMMINQGIITPQEAKNHRGRHVLTQHLGIFPEEMVVEPSVAEAVTLEAGDTFLLCSDGLTDMVEDEEICGILSAEGTPSEKAEKLVDTALSNGGRDNVTVVLVKASAVTKKPDINAIEKRLKEVMIEKYGKVNEALLAELMVKVAERLESIK